MAKIELQDFVKYGKLFDIYGKLLSQDRQKIVSSYFEYNMTLAEIAKEKNTSRQAVLDAIDKSCEKLLEYESVLHLYEKNQVVSQELRQLADSCTDDKIKEKVEEILRKI